MRHRNASQARERTDRPGREDHSEAGVSCRTVDSAVGREARKWRELPMHGGEFDPAMLASQALPFLLTYLRHVGGRLADHVAGDLDDLVVGKLTAVYDRVRAKVIGESFAGQALERLEQEPENPRRQGAFEDALAEVVDQDPSFAAVMAGLLEDARRA